MSSRTQSPVARNEKSPSDSSGYLEYGSDQSHGWSALTGKQKANIANRLKRIAGQLNGIERMVIEDRYCMDVVTQVTAIIAALRTVENIVLANHLNTCVADAVRNQGAHDGQKTIGEVMGVIGRLRERG